MSASDSAPITTIDTAVLEEAMVRARQRRGEYAAHAAKGLEDALNHDEGLIRMIGMAYLARTLGIRLSLQVDLDFHAEAVTVRASTEIRHAIPAIVERVPAA